MPRGPRPGRHEALEQEHQAVERRRHHDAQAAGEQDVRLEVLLRGQRLAQAAGARVEGERRQPHGRRQRDAQAGQDGGRGQRHLDAPEQLAVGVAHPAAGVARVLGDAVEPGQREQY